MDLAMEMAFEHAALADPKEQLRFVKMRSMPESDNSLLHMEVSTYFVSQAPRYRAISYTWGGELERNILISGKPLKIRHNRFYALQQFFSNFPHDYVWIDSICINQVDANEKSQQVNMMMSIYEQAFQVVACVGPHADDGELLISAAKDIAHSRDTLTWASWAKRTVPEEVEKVRHAFAAFQNRDYWSRLWVVQEVAASKGWLAVLCGDELVTRDEMESILFVMDPDLWEPDDERAMGVEESLHPSEYSGLDPYMEDLYSWAQCRAWDLDEIFLHLRSDERRCTDRRDTVFGVLGLVKWRQDQTLIQPDYGLSCFELACRTVKRLRCLHSVERMLYALRIDHELQEISTPAEERQARSIRQIESSAPEELHTIGAGLRAGNRLDAVPCSRIQARKDGQMVADIVLDDSRRSQSATTKSALAKLAPLVQTIAHRPIFSSKDACNSGQIAAWLCDETAAGDIIATVGGQDGELCLVLRSQTGTIYDIVGQGFLAPGCIIARGSANSSELASFNNSAEADVDLRLTSKEIILFVGQDFLSPGKWDAQARVERLRMNPATCFHGAAEINFRGNGDKFR